MGGTYAAEHFVRFGTKYGPSYTTKYALRVKEDRTFALERCQKGGGTAQGQDSQEVVIQGRIGKRGDIIFSERKAGVSLTFAKDTGISVTVRDPVSGSGCKKMLLAYDTVNYYNSSPPANPMKAILE